KTDAVELLLLEDNVKDIYEFDFGYLVVAGLSHMGLSRGALYVVSGVAPNFDVSLQFSLPAAPHSSWRLNPTELLLHMEGGTKYLFRADGSLMRVVCEDQRDDS